ncbi:MAG: GPW/gp25 family protein [Pseudomonadota bacterium]
MSLLNKFIEPRSGERKYSAALRGDDSQVESIISNIQTILQSRRTTDAASHFGLKDFCEQSISAPLMLQLCKDIQRQIQQHERRLANVQVTLADSKKNGWCLLVVANLVSEQSAAKRKSFNFYLDIARNV